MPESAERPPQEVDLGTDGRLRGASCWDLGRQLLAQLKSNATHASYNVGQEHLALYTALRDALERLVEEPDNRFAVPHFGRHFDFVRFCWEKYGVPLNRAVYVDIGCGGMNPYARMFTHLMAGASRAYCVDLAPIRDQGGALRALAHLARAALIDPHSIFGAYPITNREILVNLAGFDLAKLAKGDAVGMNFDRLCFLNTSVSATGLGDVSTDVIVSNSVLEHLPSVDDALAEFARITKPGGFGMHGIDVRDHRWYGYPALHPLEFLTIDSSEPLVHGCNRLRLSDYEPLFTRHGFKLLTCWPGEPIPVPDQLRRRFVEPWRSRPGELLGVTWMHALIQKV